MLLERKIGHYQVLGADGKTLNMIDIDHKPTIWDPNSSFMQELELYKIKSDIKPRKSTMMQAQVGMLDDMCDSRQVKKLYVPMSKGFVK